MVCMRLTLGNKKDVEDALWEMVKANEDNSDEENDPSRNY